MLLLIVVARICFWYLSVDHPLPACAQGQAVEIDALLKHIAPRETVPRRHVLQLEVIAAPACAELEGQTVRVNWYRPDFQPQAGTQLRLAVKLKRAWGSLNPGGFNYRLWLLSQNIEAMGYVTQKPSLMTGVTGFEQGVDHHRQRIERQLALVEPATRAVIGALALGETAGVEAQDWALFRATGTIHLMVVSGLHVGILAGLVGFALMLLGLPFARLLLRWPRRQTITLAVCLVVLGYAYLTGLQAPVLRASLMFCVGALCLYSLRRGTPLLFLISVALVSLLVIPEQITQTGFWLSYGAVATLLFAFVHYLRRPNWFAGLVCCQLVLFLGLTPLVGYLLGRAPLLSPLANLLVVPLVTTVTIPAAMLSILLAVSEWGDVLQFTAGVVGVSMQMTKMVLMNFPDVGIGHLSFTQMLCMLCLIPIFFLPLSRSLKGVALLTWSMQLVSLPERLAPGEVVVRVLDVGQGSAAIVDTRAHRMVVDVGAKYSATFDSGRDIVIPAIQTSGSNHLHRMLVTHFDNDHAGGLPSLRQQYPEALIVSPQQSCTSGTRWSWDQVSFLLLRHDHAAGRNGGSCTLLVQTRSRTLYFAGDIDQASELKLLAQLPRQLDLLIAPHHGSRSSSHPAFVAKLAPHWVMFSVGRENRYNHPHADVVDRYHTHGARSLRTSETGQIVWYSATNKIYAQRFRLGDIYLPFVRQLD